LPFFNVFRLYFFTQRVLGQWRRHYWKTENDFIDGWQGIYSSGMVTRRVRDGGEWKNRGRNIALVFQPFEHTNTFSPDSFGTPRLPPFYHTRWMYEYRWGLGETCIHIYYVWNDLNVPRKTENSCITLFPCFRCYSSAFFSPVTNSDLEYYVHTNMQKKSNTNSLVYILLYYIYTHTHTQDCGNDCFWNNEIRLDRIEYIGKYVCSMRLWWTCCTAKILD